MKFATVSKKNFANLTAKRFSVKTGTEKFEGFVLRVGDRFLAYQNLCKHLPVTLDLNDGQFFSHDKKALQCHMHGALFELESGKCFAGPCEGDALNSLEVIEEEERLVIRIPTAK